MNTRSRMSTSQKILSKVHLARIRLAKAVGQLATAKEVARVARRRRKEVKQAARRTKKQVRLAKREVTEAKLVVAKAEEELSRYNERADKTKSASKASKKTVATPHAKELPWPATSASPKSVTPRKAKLQPGSRKARSTSAPVVVPRKMESPVGTAPSASELPTGQIVKTIAKLSAVDVPAEAPGTPNRWPDQSGRVIRSLYAHHS